MIGQEKLWEWSVSFELTVSLAFRSYGGIECFEV